MNKYYVYKRTASQKYLGEVMPPEYFYTTGSWEDHPQSASYSAIAVNTPLFWLQTGKRDWDYLFAREQIRILSDEKFFKLDDTGKRLACQCFVVPAVTRSLYYTDDEQRDHWNYFVEQSIKCRETRWERGRSYAAYTLGINAGTQLGLDTHNIALEWRNYNTTKLFDWLQGTGDYSGSGYPTTNYYTASVGNNILEILRDGIKH